MVTHDRGEFAYAPPEARQGNRIVLSPEEAHHLLRVRRVGIGQSVMVTDGEGQVFSCVIESDGGLSIAETLHDFGEPEHPVFLGMAILKGAVNREVVDTAVQLGCTDILFFRAERSEGSIESIKLEKLQRVAVAAVKQTGRARLPRLSVCADLETVLNEIPPDVICLFAHPVVDSARKWSREEVGGGVALIVGPEGGFTSNEIAVAEQRGCYPLDLGPRRLRSETAVAAGLSFLSVRRNEFHP
ncbi:16S rRNA (uracil(1498)-N(3))-methyltransferase [candidate division KSB1 bacterium]|nr:MAG: 16S rRNA (uracil(1498)-N(3))-methyltransferase [candidate division KSB1 bacterium]